MSEDSSTTFVDVRLDWFKWNDINAPSSEGMLKIFHQSMSNPDKAYESGRPWEGAMPASLFDEALCKFRYNMDNATVEPEDLEIYEELCWTIRENYPDEASRVAAVNTKLAELGIVPEILETQQTTTDAHRYPSDGHIKRSIFVLSGLLRVLIQLIELKNELASITSGPLVQGVFYWLAHLRNLLEKSRDKKSKDGYEPGRWDNYCFPAVLLANYGTPFIYDPPEISEELMSVLQDRNWPLR